MHLFEFHDHPRIPQFLRNLLLESLELCNQRFRPYYAWVSKHVIQHVAQRGYKHVVELGAGTAPIAKAIAADPAAEQLQVTVCDLYPDPAAYRELQEKYPGRIFAVLDPVDFRQVRDWGQSSVLVLSAVFHHVPPEQRREVLEALTHSAPSVMIFEPIQKNPISVFLAATAVLPPFLLPVFAWHEPGRWRRVLWCWAIPIVPLMFLWDAVMGCFRQWTVSRWRKELAAVLRGTPRQPQLSAGVHSLIVTW